jgi:cellobiose phosphorylase
MGGVILLIKKIITDNKGYYFPLYNQYLKSSITPNLLGDLKKDYHSYLLKPTSERDLYESYGRHVLIYIDDHPYYLSGKGSKQQEDVLEVSYAPLSQHVKRINKLYQIEINSFIPLELPLELHQIKYKNNSKLKQKIKVVTATPFYGRSANNIFDHRHVTSLLNRIKVVEKGVVVKPTLSFDERGHLENELVYGFYSNSDDLSIDGYYPIYDDFVNGGSLLYPRGLNKKYQIGDEINGYEGLGGISYSEIIIKPLEEISFYLGYSISNKEEDYYKLLNENDFGRLLKENNAYFKQLLRKMEINFKNEVVSDFLKFVPLQPILRRNFGNSYLPHHDYGKGGRGWRDLFQDLLYAIFIFDQDVKKVLINNFKGVRVDGSNATIIGDKVGEFKADRNNITRVWSDHGCWPLYTTDKYLNYFNDYQILMEKVTYFEDQFTHYTKKTKNNYARDNILKSSNKPYLGTILEHLLVQNIVGSLNIGEKGFVRLENGDWNDGLDMASNKGETIAFTHFYLNNLKILTKYLKRYEKVTLFEALGELILKMDNTHLDDYFKRVANFEESSQEYETKELIKGINKYIQYLTKVLAKKGIMENGAFHSYIDDDGCFLDDKTVSLTAQAMALLNQTATKQQSEEIAKVTKEHLFTEKLGGYRLNENYQEIKMKMGRAYGFAYGHKENGAVFSHMALMYVSGLYNYNLVKKANEGLMALIKRAINEESKTPLGIPEYFNDRGIGKYFYLTGSATWLLKVIKEDLFGIKMKAGKCFLEPKLLKTDFNNGKATLKTKMFTGETLFIYENEKGLEYGNYNIKLIADGKEIKNGFDKHYNTIQVICY